MAILTNVFKVMLDTIAGATGSYGLAIIAMALLIIVITYPLNARQMSFSYKMKIVNPKMEAIKKQIKDPTKQNEEIMKLWQEHGVNPAAGCLPLLVQLPVFIAMFGVLRQEGAFGANHFFLGLDLILPDATNTFWSLVSSGKIGYLLVPILSVVTTVIQQRQMTTNQQDSTTRTMNLMLPVFTGYLTITYPTALGLYWVSRNVFTIGQYYLFNQQMARRSMLEEDSTDANDKRGKTRKDS